MQQTEQNVWNVALPSLQSETFCNIKHHTWDLAKVKHIDTHIFKYGCPAAPTLLEAWPHELVDLQPSLPPLPAGSVHP